MSGQRKMQIRDIVFIGVLAAMCTLATSLKIPFGVGAMVHLGTAFLYTAAILFGGVYAGLAGAIGSAFFDLLMGFSPYTPWSFIIKGSAGFIAGFVAHGVWPEQQSGTEKTGTVLQSKATGKWWPAWGKALLGCFLAAVWTLAGYLLAWWQVSGSWTVAVTNVPSSLLTSGVGLVVAVVLAPKLRNMLNF